jgi:non-heme chloroperoxidase
MTTLTDVELADIEKANASGLTPVVFVHGLWLLPSSWDRWRAFAEAAGFTTIAPGWPDDPETVAEGNADPSVFAKKGIRDIADHVAAAIEQLTVKPAVIGHSFGGLLAQIVAGRGLSAATVAIDPAPFQGVLPLPVSALKSGSPVLSNPANYQRAVPHTNEQFRYAFVNAEPEDEAKEQFEAYAVPGAGQPLFQAAAANFNPWSQDKVKSKNPDRGPLLIVSGELDHTVPWSIANASYKRQRRNVGVTEIVEIKGVGHSLVIDHGWQDVAQTALDFVKRFVS